MTKFCCVVLICCLAMVSAELPDWYPQDEPAIEAKCRDENSISSDTMTKIWSHQIDDTPEIRKFLLCLAENKNVFNSDMGFKADRLQIIMKERAKMDCKLEFIEECEMGAKDMKPDDAMIFNIMKCIVGGIKENCKKIE
ncbi:uncharacterized protein LOC101897433 [Musca domestica]|uniref:Uncharacterized protein LOC101897433 n=1 Tax=Musca domestica TaxID=7370 RepID=A0A1I8N7C8_MUSDO|nr:uncharacterized protein LOC101897433 [Musca domestica]